MPVRARPVNESIREINENSWIIGDCHNAGLTGVADKSCWAERYVQVYLQDVRQREKGDEKEKCSANLYVLLHFCSNTIPPQLPQQLLYSVPNTCDNTCDNHWQLALSTHFDRDRVLLSRQHLPSSNFTWSDGKGSFYFISKAPYPLPPSRPLPSTTHIQMVYDAGGNVSSLEHRRRLLQGQDPGSGYNTREHVTLNYLHNKRPLSFAIPDVYYHAEFDGRYYILLSRLTGQTLIEAWTNMDDAMKQHYVSRVVKICKELAVWQADCISGVDGQHLSDEFLTRKGLPKDFSPRNLLINCKDLGMDCSSFIFYHCDLGPGNIIVNPKEGSIGIIDWETAGFVPKEWIRSKFRISSGMDLLGCDQESRVDWRRRVQRKLEKEGFPDIVEQ